MINTLFTSYNQPLHKHNPQCGPVRHTSCSSVSGSFYCPFTCQWRVCFNTLPLTCSGCAVTCLDLRPRHSTFTRTSPSSLAGEYLRRGWKVMSEILSGEEGQRVPPEFPPQQLNSNKVHLVQLSTPVSSACFSHHHQQLRQQSQLCSAQHSLTDRQ